MIDMPWSVLTGAMVVKKDVWEKLPADLRPKLIDIAREYAQKIGVEVRRMDEEALATMKTQGLSVEKGDSADMMKAAKAAWTVIRGRVVPADIFDEVRKLVEEAHKAGH
jgi:TRAP-type C4-dicarboxylate transport system substrate-binding protein